MIEVIWNRSETILELGIIMENSSFRVYEINLDLNILQCTQAFDSRPVSSIVSTPLGWVAGHMDGSMTILAYSEIQNERIVDVHIPPQEVLDGGDVIAGRPFGIYSLQLMSPDVVLVGQCQYAEGKEFGEKDPNQVNIAVFNLKSLQWIDYGDVLRDNEKCHEDEDDKVLDGRWKLYSANLPELLVES